MGNKTRHTANLVSDNNLFVDIANDRVGIGSTQPTAKLNVAGIVSATSFRGDGSQLTGISVDSTSLVDSNSTTRVQANAAGAVVTGILTATKLFGDASNVTGIVTTNLGKANVTISDNPPGIGTAHGDLWWESDTAKGHIYYNDGSSAQWVEFTPSSGGGGGGGGGSYGNADVDSHLNVSGASAGEILSWNGSDYAWVADQTGGGGSGITTANINADTLNVTGVSTFGTGAKIPAGQELDIADRLKLFSNGGNQATIHYSGQGSGDALKYRSRTHQFMNEGGSATLASFNADNINFNIQNSPILQVADYGVTVTGTTFSNQLSVSGVSTFTGGLVDVQTSGVPAIISNWNSSKHLQMSTGDNGGGFNITDVNYFAFNHQPYADRGTNNNLTERLRITTGGIVQITGGANVSGVVTATSFSGITTSMISDYGNGISGGVGAGSTNLVTTWTLGANGSSDYTFTGPGVADGAQDPTIYLVRGQTYKFENRSGGHPFRIQYEFQNTSGTAYNDGIVNNAANHNTDLYWEVRNDAPDLLHYQCTAHQNMSGRIVILGDVVGSGSWTASAGTPQTIDTITGVANNAIKTAEYTIHIENGSNMQAQKVLVMQDGTTAYSQEYAIMHKSGLLVSMSATISGGNLLLQATPETGVSGTTTYKVTRQTMR